MRSLFVNKSGLQDDIENRLTTSVDVVNTIKPPEVDIYIYIAHVHKICTFVNEQLFLYTSAARVNE